MACVLALDSDYIALPARKLNHCLQPVFGVQLCGNLFIGGAHNQKRRNADRGRGKNADENIIRPVKSYIRKPEREHKRARQYKTRGNARDNAFNYRGRKAFIF